MQRAPQNISLVVPEDGDSIKKSLAQFSERLCNSGEIPCDNTQLFVSGHPSDHDKTLLLIQYFRSFGCLNMQLMRSYDKEEEVRQWVQVASVSKTFEFQSLYEIAVYRVCDILSKHPDLACSVMDETVLLQEKSNGTKNFIIFKIATKIIYVEEKAALLPSRDSIGNGVLGFGRRSVGLLLSEELNYVSRLSILRCLTRWGASKERDILPQKGSQEGTKKTESRLRTVKRLAKEIDIKKIGQDIQDIAEIQNSPLLSKTQRRHAVKEFCAAVRGRLGNKLTYTKCIPKEYVIVEGAGYSDVNGVYIRCNGEDTPVPKYKWLVEQNGRSTRYMLSKIAHKDGIMRWTIWAIDGEYRRRTIYFCGVDNELNFNNWKAKLGTLPSPFVIHIDTTRTEMKK